MLENITADLFRLSDGKCALRPLVRGVLSQGFQAIMVYRFFRWLKVNNVPSQPFRFIFERFIEMTTGISIPVECQIGKGLRIYHFGGIIFHPSVEIGENSTIYHEVTIGDRGGYGGAAKIGNNVLIGAGAKIIGEIEIGNNCVVGANTVLAKDLKDNSIASGNPCQIRKRKDITELVGSNSKASIQIMDLRGTYKGGGGPDKTILNSAAMHDKKRVNILVTYLRDPEDKEFDINVKAFLLKINYKDVDDKKLLDFNCLSDLNALIKEHNITLLHAHDDKTLLYGWFLKFFNSGLIIIYTCHSHSSYKKDKFQSSLSYYKYCLREKTQIFIMKRYHKPLITVSENTKKRLIDNGLSSKNIEVLYNGVDIDCWKKGKGKPLLKEEFNVLGGQYMVGTVARITYDKDFPTFYEIAGLVSEQIEHITFVIVGDGYGDELERAKKEVVQLGLDHIVKFTGYRTNLLDIYSSLDLFLMTSLTEGLPNTVLEAMSMQVPVVSTSVGGVPELVVDNQTGFLSDKGDAKNLSKQVITLLKNDQLRKEFAVKSRAIIEERFSFSGRVKKMEDYYERFSCLGPSNFNKDGKQVCP